MTTDLTIDFISKASSQISMEKVSHDVFEILTPYTFSDGDHFSIILKKEGKKWILSDEGDTFMHLEILGISEVSLLNGTRHKILSAILEQFSVIDRDGELVLEINDNNYDLAFYNFSQALIKISDLEFLSRERTKKTFLDDFRDLISEAVDINRCVFDWNDRLNDPIGKYLVDCKINSMQKPIMIFALNNEVKTSNSTITIHQLQKWGMDFYPVGIFNDMTQLNKKTVSRFIDVCGKAYSNINDKQNRNDAIDYLHNLVAISSSI